ncbi:SpoIIE family protein phosphatase [Pseudonocardia halophobica]|uniref:SpoIIE family protein phosphatase n=1 Tax=Pseudonocardia halophobica TaxID=29401 RepID=UPI003D8B51E9
MGGYRLLEDGLSVPLAVLPGAPRPEAVAALPPGGTLLLYTDGLVERRGEEVDLGIARAGAALGELAADPGTPVGDVLDGLTARLLGPGPDDDVAALVYRHEAGPRAGREVRWHYEPLPGATIRIRHRLVELLTGWGVRGDAAQDAELVLTELVANVVDHARTPFVVGVGLDDGTLRLSVRDGSASLPAVRPVDPLAVRGRGTQLVEALTLRWGHEGDGEAKTVWAELPAV